MTESEAEQARLDIDIDAAKCRRYHDYIRSYWHSLDYWTKVLSLFSGTATFVSALQGWDLATKWLAFLLALLTAADVVLGFADQGKKHDDLYKRFSDLGVDIELCAKPTEGDVRNWRAERIRIEGDESSAHDWLERRCAREEAISAADQFTMPGKLAASKLSCRGNSGFQTGEMENYVCRSI